MKKNILIISHDASPGGAQNSILNFSKILSSLDFEIHIILKQGGSLKEDFEKLGTCYHWNKLDILNSNIFIRILNKFIHLNHYYNLRITKKINNLNPELCISNTITNHEIVKELNKNKIKIITWVHELNYMYNIIEKVSLENPKEIINSTDFFLCASKSVQKNLFENHKVPFEKTHVFYEIINEKNPSFIEDEKTYFKVGGCGAIGWRKGTDIFLSVANQIVNVLKISDIKFEWLGAQPNSIGLLQFEEEIKKLNLENHVKAMSFEKNSNEFMKSINLFLMTSREDPFPLVNIEAALNLCPVLCFKGTGGSEEFALEDNIFSYTDTLSMAKRVEFYKENLALLRSDGNLSFQKASQFTMKSKTKELEELMLKLLNNE